MAKISARPYDYALPTDSHLALVIIDMQRDFLESGGFGEALGNDVSQCKPLCLRCSVSDGLFRRMGDY